MVAPRPGGTEQPCVQSGAAGGRGHAAGECAEKPLRYGAFCYEHGGKISGGWTQNYCYIVETEHYRYCLRCNPSPGDYNCYCTAYDLDVQRQNMVRDKPLMGRVSYANGDTQEFTDAEAFLKCVREELPYRPTTGFRYEVLTDDPSVRKQVDDMIFDFYGEEAPCRQEDHESRPEQGMTFGGM